MLAMHMVDSCLWALMINHLTNLGGQVEMDWACTTPRRGLCQENFGGIRTWTTE